MNDTTEDAVKKLYPAAWEIRYPAAEPGFEVVKYHGTNAVSDYRDHLHPEAYSRALVYMEDAIAYADARCAALRGALQAVYAELQQVTPWSESNDMDLADEMICGIGLLAQDLDALRAERDALAEKVKAMEDNDRRYRALRAMAWDRSPLAVVVNPRAAVKLGHDCPSHERLDAAIDAAEGGMRD